MSWDLQQTWAVTAKGSNLSLSAHCAPQQISTASVHPARRFRA